MASALQPILVGLVKTVVYVVLEGGIVQDIHNGYRGIHGPAKQGVELGFADLQIVLGGNESLLVIGQLHLTLQQII